MSQRPDGFSSSQLSSKEKADNNPLEYRDAISSSNENITTIIDIRPFSSIHENKTATKSTKNTKIFQSSGTIAKVIPGTEVDSPSISLESDTSTTDSEIDSEWERTVKLFTQYSTNKEKRTKFIKTLRDKTKELNRKTPDIAESSTSRTPLNQKNIEKSQIPVIPESFVSREFLKQRNINKSQSIIEEIENDSELAKEVAFLCKNPKYKATLKKYIRNHIRRIQKSKMSSDSCNTNVETSQLPSTMQSKTTTGATSTQCISDEISKPRTSEVPITKDDQLKNRSEISPSEHSNSGPDPEFQLGSETQTTQISSTTTNETKSHTEKIEPQNTCKIIPKIQVPRNTNPEGSKTSENLLPINTENSTCEKNQSTSPQLSPKYPSSQPNESDFVHDSRDSENLNFSNTDYQASVEDSTSETDEQLRYFASASSTPKSFEKAQFIPNVQLKATSALSRILIRTTDKSPPKTNTSVSEPAKIHSEEGSKTPSEVAQISSTFFISEHNTNAEDTIPEKLSVFSNDTLQMSGIPSNSTNENKDSQNNLVVPITTKNSSPKTKQQTSSKAQNTDQTLHSLNYFDTSFQSLIEYLIQKEDSDTSVMSHEFLNSTNENKTEESENSPISSPFPDIDHSLDINPMVIQATETHKSTTFTSLHSQNITTSQNTPDIILEHTAGIENSSQEANQSPAPSTLPLTNLHAPTSSSLNNTDDKTISGSDSPNDLETCFMTAAEHLIRSEEPKISTCEREIVNAPIETPNETTGSSKQKDDLTNKIYSLVQLINDQLSTLSNSHVTRHSSTITFPSINTLSTVESSMQASEQTFPSINTSSIVIPSVQASEQITEENLVTKSDILRPIMPKIIISLQLPTFSCSTSSITDSYKVSAYSILSTREIKSKPELLELVIKYVIEESSGPKNDQQSNQTSSKSDKRTPYSADSDFLTFNLNEFSTPTFSSDHEQQSTAETQEISTTCEPSSSGIQNTRSSSEAALTKGVEQQAESSSPHTSIIKDHHIHEGNENSTSEGELTKEVQKQAESSFPHIIKDHHIHEGNENSTSEGTLTKGVEQQAESSSPHIIKDHRIHEGNENLPSTRHLEGLTNLRQTSTIQPPNNVMLPASPPPYSFYPQCVNLPAAVPPPLPFRSNSNIRNIYPITDEDPFIQASYIRRFGRLSLPPHSEINFHIHPRSNNCRPSPSPEQRSLTLEEYFGRHPQIIPPPREFMGQEQNQAISNPNPGSFQRAFPSRGHNIIPPPDEFNTNPSSPETNKASASGLSEITPRTEIFSADRRLFIDSVERNQQEIPGTSQTTESESNNDEKNDSKKRSYLRWVPGGIYKHLKDKKKKKESDNE